MGQIGDLGGGASIEADSSASARWKRAFGRNDRVYRKLRWFWRCGNWVCFAKKRRICREISTYVEGRRAGRRWGSGVVGVGEDLGFGSYGEGLLIRDLPLTICYLLVTTDYLALAIGRSVFTIDY